MVDSADPMQRILSTVRQLEDKVSTLKGTTDLLRAEKHRWDELKLAGTPRRLAAAADAARDKGREAAAREKEARQAEHQALIAQKQCEQSVRDSAAQTLRSEDAARRAEERCNASEKAYTEWRRRADAALAEAREQQRLACTEARSRLASLEAEAEKRNGELNEHVLQVQAQVDFELEKECETIRRQQEFLTARAEDSRALIRSRIEAAEAAAKAAEAKHARHAEAAERRTERSRAAAASKIRSAKTSSEDTSFRTTERLDHANDESRRRLDAAHARLAEAEADLEKRRTAAAARIEKAEQERQRVREEGEEHRRELKARLANFKKELEVKGLVRDAAVREAAAASRKKATEVWNLAEELKAAQRDEVARAEAHAKAEVYKLRDRFRDHATLLSNTLDQKRSHTREVAELAASRVAEAEVSERDRLALTQERASVLKEQASHDVASHEVFADGRVEQAVGHLMTYLDHGEEPEDILADGVHLELWVPLPGTPD